MQSLLDRTNLRICEYAEDFSGPKHTCVTQRSGKTTMATIDYWLTNGIAKDKTTKIHNMPREANFDHKAVQAEVQIPLSKSNKTRAGRKHNRIFLPTLSDDQINRTLLGPIWPKRPFNEVAKRQATVKMIVNEPKSCTSF